MPPALPDRRWRATTLNLSVGYLGFRLVGVGDLVSGFFLATCLAGAAFLAGGFLPVLAAGAGLGGLAAAGFAAGLGAGVAAADFVVGLAGLATLEAAGSLGASFGAAEGFTVFSGCSGLSLLDFSALSALTGFSSFLAVTLVAGFFSDFASAGAGAGSGAGGLGSTFGRSTAPHSFKIALICLLPGWSRQSTAN